ncbi:hypothetical protein [Streptomyces griseosporeus]|uniref:hypothetical protein n=1 Tax=Streptomyces griseosporeus TaxID=1910 RepID=UPI0037A60EE1
MNQGSIRMPAVTTACAGHGCARRADGGGDRRPAEPGARLCRPCRDHLVRDLTRLPELYEECARHLDGSGGERCVERTSGGPLPGTPFNSWAAEVRSSILAVLGSWATLVVEELGLAGPRRAVGPLAAFLLRHSGWLARHDAAGDLSAEVARLVRRAHSVMDPVTRRRIPIGECVEPGCPGGLTAVVRPQHPKWPATITCTADRSHRWFGPELLQLSRRLGGAAASARGATAGTTDTTGTTDRTGTTGMPRTTDTTGATTPTGADAEDRPGSGAAAPQPETRWVTAADIARLWSMPPGSVYRHASTRKWRRRSQSGRTYYHAADVYETLKHRAGAA